MTKPSEIKDSCLELNEFEKDDWQNYGKGERWVRLTIAEQEALLTSTDPSLAAFRQRLATYLEVSAEDRDTFILAQRKAQEGELEIDDNAVISSGDDNGAYVQSWTWVSYAGTPLDKEPNEEDRAAANRPANG